MFKFDKEINYVCKDKEFIQGLWNIQWAEENEDIQSCTCASNVYGTLKSTFQFIKDHPKYYDNTPAGADIVLGVFLLENQTQQTNNFNFAVTYMYGVVKKVYDTFVILESNGPEGEKLQVVILYKAILRVYHPSISENFAAYVNYVNSNNPPLCKAKNNENLDILRDLAIILGRNNPKQGNFVFIYDGILTREFKPEEIAIVRNLIVLDEAFVVPVTSISGFSQIAVCE